MKVTSNVLHDIFSVLGDPLRLRLACCLLGAKNGLTVAELTDSLGEPQPNVSRHLKLMKASGLVDERREGRWIYHVLREVEHPFFDNIRCCVETACCCGDIQQDLRRLRDRLKLRQDGKCVVGFRSSAQTRQPGKAR